MPTIVTTECLYTALGLKQEALKKCDGTALLAGTAVPTCTEFTAVSGNLVSVSSALNTTNVILTAVSNNLSTVSGSLTAVSNSLTSVSGNLSLVSGNLSSVSSALNNALASLTGTASSGSVGAVSSNLSLVSSTLNVTNATVTAVSNNLIAVSGNLQSVSSALANKATYQDIIVGTDDDKIVSAKDIYEAFATSKPMFIDIIKPVDKIGFSLVTQIGSSSQHVVYIEARDMPGGDSANVVSIRYNNSSGGNRDYTNDISAAVGLLGSTTPVGNDSINMLSGSGYAVSGIVGATVIGQGSSTAVRGQNFGRSNNTIYGGLFDAYGQRGVNTPNSTNIGAGGQARAGFDNIGLYGAGYDPTVGTNYGGKFIAYGGAVNNYAVWGSGNAYFTGYCEAQSFITSSDKQLKTKFKAPKDILQVKIQQYTKALPQVIYETVEIPVNGEINNKTFDVKVKRGKDGKPEYNLNKTKIEIGVIAQDIQALIPELVSKNERGDLTIDTVSVIYAYLASIQNKLVILDKDVKALQASSK